MAGFEEYGCAATSLNAAADIFAANRKSKNIAPFVPFVADHISVRAAHSTGKNLFESVCVR